MGEQGVIWLLAATSLVGAACTMFVILETARRSLEDINTDGDTRLGAVGAASD